MIITATSPLAPALSATPPSGAIVQAFSSVPVCDRLVNLLSRVVAVLPSRDPDGGSSVRDVRDGGFTVNRSHSGGLTTRRRRRLTVILLLLFLCFVKGCTPEPCFAQSVFHEGQRVRVWFHHHWRSAVMLDNPRQTDVWTVVRLKGARRFKFETVSLDDVRAAK